MKNSIKNKLATYLALGALTAGSVGNLSCSGLERKIQPAAQSVCEEPALSKFYTNLKREYEKFRTMNLTESERKEIEKSAGRKEYERYDREILELAKKSGFIELDNPKDIDFINKYKEWFVFYLDLDKVQKAKLRVPEKNREIIRQNYGNFPINLRNDLERFRRNPQSFKDFDNPLGIPYVRQIFSNLEVYKKMGLIKPEKVSEEDLIALEK